MSATSRSQALNSDAMVSQTDHSIPRSLLVNINNSFSKAAVWNGSELRHLGKVPTSSLSPEPLLRWLRRSRAQQMIVASVVPQFNPLIRATTPLPIHQINHVSPLGIRVDFPRPATVGADRLANAAAVCAYYTPPAIVIDYGTAITFDIISGKNEYLGGVIAPGLRVFRDYLAERTALLPRIQLKRPSHAIGRSTVLAMQSGAYFGYRGLVREIIREIQRELGVKRLAILATGGDSDLFLNETGLFHIHDPDLTFKGMAHVANQPELLFDQPT
ncbi:MAG: type III pantothenate kinase [Candidatus Methylacidiphilales bacterium]